MDYAKTANNLTKTLNNVSEAFKPLTAIPSFRITNVSRITEGVDATKSLKNMNSNAIKSVSQATEALRHAGKHITLTTF